jgi:SAM-dependent methyltransferase
VFGYDRGGPVDRFYIERFLELNAQVIGKRVLEIGDNSYTMRFGKDRITKSDVLHIDPSNKNATYIGDLGDASQIEDNIFDCIILTQTLHLIYNYNASLRTCYRILRPGGTLLLTVPGISPIDKDEWKDTWFWSFNSNSVDKMLKEVFEDHKVEIAAFGNVFVATAFLYGMGISEVTNEQLQYCDDRYQVIITAKATK